ncbi:MAG: DUF4403 family protein [Polyangiaceae bacterium]|nr:DUF4403 family protein [Polyangiaceae bacterium]
MLRRAVASIAVAFAIAAVASCSRFGAVYPPRPPGTAGEPMVDPTPSRVVAHVSVTSGALARALEEAVPRRGDGSFNFHGERRYDWSRDDFTVGFSQGRVVIDARVRARLAAPIFGHLEFPLDLHVVAEPVVNTEYTVRLQSTEVKVQSVDRRLAVADYVAGVYATLGEQIHAQVKAFSYDLKPLVSEAYARMEKPVSFDVGDATACAELGVLGVEAGPLVVADGLEKDIALIIAPRVTLPCGSANKAASSSVASAEPPRPTLPPLANVATIVPGPFTVTIPIAARYDELTRAMSATFTNGKYFFSTEYPDLYLEKPEVYESQGQLVLKVHIQGPVHKFGISTDLDGDLYLTGKPAVIDNELRIPDLEPTIETRNLLLSLKAMADSDKIRDQARAALRLDIGDRIRPIRDKLSSDLTFGTESGCFRGAVDKVEVTGVHPHASYLRVYVSMTGRAAVTVPCAK